MGGHSAADPDHQAPAAGPGVLLVLFAGGYSLGAHASLRRAAAGLAITAPS